MTPTHEVVNRCLALIPLLREHQELGLLELARRAQLSPEQIRDELGSVLMMCGVPPYFPHHYIGFFIEGNRVRISFADQFRRPVSLSALEALALKLACESLTAPGEPVPEPIANLLSKVEQGMTADRREQFRILSRRVAVRESDDLPSGLTHRAALGVAERREAKLWYVAAGRSGSRERLIHPYGLVSREGFWYLVARDLSRQEVVPFRLDRVQSIELTDNRFEIPPDFRLERFAQGPLGPVGGDVPVARVRFSGASARWVRETAETGTLADEGESAVVWHLPSRDLSALARFVIRFGTDAQVLHPPELASEVNRLLTASLAAHV